MVPTHSEERNEAYEAMMAERKRCASIIMAAATDEEDTNGKLAFCAKILNQINLP